MITVTAIPAFYDNYLWLLEGADECWVVDPGDAKPVQAALDQRNLSLTGILITHHHMDHVGGVKALATDSTQIIGPALHAYPAVRDRVEHGNRRRVCGVEFDVIEVPGHTLNHLAYFAAPEAQVPLLFCGDTLFAGGCGRLFEGSPAQMRQSLSQLSRLPSQTQVFCAHEYTQANLKFALTVEPGNAKLVERAAEVARIRELNESTVPTSIQVELDTNPFLRVDQPEVLDSVRRVFPSSASDPDSIFAAVRKMKDDF